MEAIKKNEVPYHIRSGFFVFLESERLRHLEDVRKIEKMQDELISITPEFTSEVIKKYVKFSKRFVEFEL